MASGKKDERPRDSLWMSLLAAAFFVAWGLYVNWEYGWGSRLQVSLTQGFLGLAATFFSAELVVWLVRKFREGKHPVIYPAVASWVIIYAIVWLAHLLAGTPELLMTMLPGMISGVFFSFGYSRRVVNYPLSGRPRS